MDNEAGNRIVAVESTLMVSNASILDGSEICCGDATNVECVIVTLRGMQLSSAWVFIICISDIL